MASRIVELANGIHESILRLDTYLKSNGLPSPSFDEDGPVDFGIKAEEIQEARNAALGCSLELYKLLLGPALCLRPVYNGVSLQTIWKYDIASKVPIHGEISFKELAEKCGLTEVNLRRILRYAMAFHHVFKEPRKGSVAHTAASRKLLEDPFTRDGCGYMFDEVWQSFAHTVPALEKFEEGDEPNQTGWNIYQGTEKTAWEYYSDHPDMAKRFAGAMSCFTDGHGLSPSFLIKGYPWSSIGNGTGTIVDVGGSKGTVMAEIAKSVPGLKFIIQDLPDMIQGAKEEIPSDVTERVDFMVHDFFKEQTVQADAYFFRYIFHNWSDRNSIKILKALVPALKPGARVIINDHVLPEPGTSSYIKERAVRDMDMIMLSLYNSREREKDDWEMLFREADTRFKHVKMWVPEGAMLGIVEATWEP